MFSYCPGSEKFRHPTPEMLQCGTCTEEDEIWTDEVQAMCPKCAAVITRAGRQGCLGWCKFARECVGDAAYERYERNNKEKTR